MTLTSTAATPTILSASQAFNHLTLNGVGGTWTLQDALDVNGNLTITNGTLDVNSTGNYGINLAGNWTNNGTFTEQSGTVTLDGGAGTTQLLKVGSTAGTERFFNLTKDTPTPARELI